MNSRLCVRFGVVEGGAVGLLLGLLHGQVCCTPPMPPTWAQLALDGLIVALLAGFISALFARLVTHIPLPPLLLLAFFVSILVGILLGPLAYHLPHPWLAVLVCALVGGLLGWLICRLVCGKGRVFFLEATR